MSFFLCPVGRGPSTCPVPHQRTGHSDPKVHQRGVCVCVCVCVYMHVYMHVCVSRYLWWLILSQFCLRRMTPAIVVSLIVPCYTAWQVHWAQVCPCPGRGQVCCPRLQYFSFSVFILFSLSFSLSLSLSHTHTRTHLYIEWRTNFLPCMRILTCKAAYFYSKLYL